MKTVTYKETQYQSGTFFRAEALNQYKRPIGYGKGATPEDAICAARQDATKFLAQPAVNRNWKWRYAGFRVEKWIPA